jgi:hypothetical protein
MASILSVPVILLLALSSVEAAAAECEVTGFSPYEDVRITRDDSGFLFQEIHKCAEVTFRNTGFRGRYATSYRFKAIFDDGSSGETWMELEDRADRFRRLEPGEDFTAYGCFGPKDAEIVDVECE